VVGSAAYGLVVVIRLVLELAAEARRIHTHHRLPNRLHHNSQVSHQPISSSSVD
jgi:hypothetical protein